nr:hypothetical protein [Tanacetum cinerariifolium]
MMKGSNIGIQEKNAKLFNEWERFTSNEGESIESYYHRFLKLMNDLKRNKHFPEKIASNLKFLNNLQPEWSQHMVGGNGGNQFRQYAGQNAGNPTGYNDVIGNQKEEAGIQLQAEEYDLMAAAADLDDIEEVNANCILMANLQQASTLATQSDSAPVYDTDGSAENDNDIVSEVTGVEQGGEIVEQHPANFKETHALYDSLYHNLATEVEKVNSVNRKMTIETHNWASSAHQEFHKIVREENFPIINQVDARVQNFKIQFLKKAAKFVGDFKSLAKEADYSLSKHKAMELDNERLLKAVVDTSDLQTELERMKERFENCIIKKETEYAKLWNDWYKKCNECKYDKISYDKAYKDMQQKIERLQAQLGDLKGKCKDTSCVSDTEN